MVKLDSRVVRNGLLSICLNFSSIKLGDVFNRVPLELVRINETVKNRILEYKNFLIVMKGIVIEAITSGDRENCFADQLLLLNSIDRTQVTGNSFLSLFHLHRYELFDSFLARKKKRKFVFART